MASKNSSWHGKKRNVIAIVVVTLIVLIIALTLREYLSTFIWRYYTGPIVADAQGRAIGDIAPVYNPVNTLTYGLILVLALLYIYKLFKRLDIVIDHKFLVALAPYVLCGAFARVSEDAGMVKAPLVYLFISPLIYIALGLGTIICVLFAHHLRAAAPVKRFLSILTAFVVMDMVVLSSVSYLAELPMPYALLPLLTLVCVLPNVIYRTRNTQLGTFGLFLFMISAALLATRSWSQPELMLPILALTCLTTALVYVTFRTLGYLQYAKSAYITLYFVHMLDATATFVGVDLLGYFEKHPLPSLLIDLTGTALVMYPLKLGILTLAIYMLEFRYKDDIDRTMAGLIKLCIFVLGLAPGVRDMLRIGMGV